jgi:hypothetical protein
VGVGEANAHFAKYIIDQIDTNGSMCIKPDVWQAAKAWREVLMAVAGVGKEASAKKLGQWFNKNRDIIDDGLVIRGRLDAHTAMNVWWVEDV